MKKLVMTALALLLFVASSFAQAPASSDVLGEWDLTTISPVGENTNTVEFKKDGDSIKAVAKSPQGERPYDSTAVEGNKVTLVLTIDFQGQPMTITYMGTVTDKSIDGSADFGGLAMGSFSAKRKEAAK
ncbi:MAG: hypothetical protein U0Q11_18665 [Vicinamibacterales bacterium]